MPPESTSGGGPRITGGRKTFALCTVIFSLAVIVIVLFSHQGLYKIYRLRQERARLERENARLAEENTRLARTIDRLHHDPEMIQDLIRRELNFVKKNEIIIQFPGEGGAKPPVGAAPRPRPLPPQYEKIVSDSPRHKEKKAPGAPRRAP